MMFPTIKKQDETFNNLNYWNAAVNDEQNEQAILDEYFE